MKPFLLKLPILVSVLFFVARGYASSKKAITAGPVTVYDTVPAKDSAGVIQPSAQKVETEASIDKNFWRKHLETSLPKYLEQAVAGNAPNGKYTVRVKFMVEKDGTVNNISIVGSEPGYGLGQGAVEVMKRSPKWNPATLNGEPVRSYKTQPVTFFISTAKKS